MGFFRKLAACRQARPEHFTATPLVPQQTAQKRKSLEVKETKPQRSDASLFQDKLTLRVVDDFWRALSAAVLQRGKATEDLDAQTFVDLMLPVLPKQDPFDTRLLQLLFDRIDRRRASVLKATDVATGLVLLCAADNFAKMRSLFNIFDTDDDHCLSQNEIFQLYFAIRRNALAKERSEMVADILFDDELALQQARRLYERTVDAMRGKPSLDLLVYDEFARLPYIGDVFHELFPVTFTLEFALREYRPQHVTEGSLALVEETKRSFRAKLRRGCEELLLDKPGQGLRIMTTMLNQPNFTQAVQEVKHQLPRLGHSRRPSALKQAQRDVTDELDALDSQEEVRVTKAPPSMRGRATQAFVEPETKPGKQVYSIEKVHAEICEKDLPTLPLAHPNGTRFRQMVWNEKSAQVYADKEVKRRFKYSCLLCTMMHDLNLNRQHEKDKEEHC